MNICKYLCHQKPERSFFYKKKQITFCSRCTGIVIGAAAGFVLASLNQLNLIITDLNPEAPILADYIKAGVQLL